MAVVVIGASSQIGHFLLQRLSQTRTAVLAVSRRGHAGQALDGVEWIRADLPHLALLQQPVEAMASFGPMDRVAEWLAQQQRAPMPKLVTTSSMSVLSKRDSAETDERELAQRLATGEQALIAQCERLGIDWLILRPTLIYGAGLDRSLTPIAQRALRWRVFPVPMANGLRQPVHADDIARAVQVAFGLPRLGGRVLQIGGGERLPYREMFMRVRASLPRSTVCLPLPMGMMRWLARCLPRIRGPVSRLQQDLAADNRELIQILGVQPRPFRPDAQTWCPHTTESH